MSKSTTAALKQSTISNKLLMTMALKNLTYKKLRSILTISGVVIGIGSVFLLISFGLGLRQLVTEEVTGAQSIKTIDVNSPNSRIVKLDQSSVDRIADIPDVSQIGTSYSLAGKVALNEAATDTVVFGVNNEFYSLSNISLVSGKAFDDEQPDAIVINMSLLRAFGIEDKATEVLDSELTVEIDTGSDQTSEPLTKTFTVAGIAETGSGAELFVPQQAFTAYELKSFSQAKVTVEDTDKVANVRAQIEALGFETLSPLDTVEQINQVFRFFTIALLGFGAIGMFIAVIGMFNTLTISLLERTQEIGLMRAIGGRRKDMRKLFIFEAQLISILGAIAGIVLALILATLINLVFNSLARTRGVTETFSLFSFPLWLVLSMLLFMATVGIIVAYLPARRASRINPIDALRHE